MFQPIIDAMQNAKAASRVKKSVVFITNSHKFNYVGDYVFRFGKSEFNLKNSGIFPIAILASTHIAWNPNIEFVLQYFLETPYNIMEKRVIGTVGLEDKRVVKEDLILFTEFACEKYNPMIHYIKKYQVQPYLIEK